MKQIKFRAWHTEQKRMFEVYGLGIDFVTENTLDGVDPGNNCWQGEELKFIKVMQYTGLKDKNGIPIYEGDICRILYTDWPSNTDPNLPLEEYLSSISHIGYIEYIAPSYYIMLKDRYGDFSHNNLSYGTHGRIEIIGNVYEKETQHPQSSSNSHSEEE